MISRLRRIPFKSLLITGAAALALVGLAAAGLVGWPHAVALLLVLGALWSALFEARRTLQRRIVSGFSELEGEVGRRVQSLGVEVRSALALERRMGDVTMPVSGWSMTATNLAVLLDILDRKRPRLVVELGSGISTLVTAAWLHEEAAGRLVSFDHEEEWAGVTESFLERHRLEDRAEVRRAPLVPRPERGEDVRWYDLEGRVDDLVEIDLLVVDGPPGATCPRARHPAVPFFHSRLSPSGVVLLDDGGRRDEEEIVRAWLAEHPDLQARFLRTLTGCWILTRGTDGR